MIALIFLSQTNRIPLSFFLARICTAPFSNNHQECSAPVNSSRSVHLDAFVFVRLTVKNQPCGVVIKLDSIQGDAAGICSKCNCYLKYSPVAMEEANRYLLSHANIYALIGAETHQLSFTDFCYHHGYKQFTCDEFTPNSSRRVVYQIRQKFINSESDMVQKYSHFLTKF